MTDDSRAMIYELHREVEGLKESVQRLRILTFVGIFAAAAVGMAPGLIARSVEKSRPVIVPDVVSFNTVEVDRLVLKDRDGTTRATLGYGDKVHAYLRMFADEKLCIDQSVWSNGVPSLAFYNGNFPSYYVQGGPVPEWAMRDTHGDQRIHAAVFGDNPYMVMNSDRLNCRIQFGVHPGGVPFMDFFDPLNRRIRLFDSKGDPMIPVTIEQ